MKRLFSLIKWYLYAKTFRIGVFISYFRTPPDNEFAEWVDKGLTRRDFDVFRDNRLTGGQWEKQIEKEIEKRPTSVIIETPEAQRSKEIGKEARLMIENKSHLVPVLFIGNDIRPVLLAYQYVDFRNINYKKRRSPSAEDKLDELGRCLRNEPARPDQTPPPYTRRLPKGASLRLTAFLILFVFLLPGMVIKGVSIWQHKRQTQVSIRQLHEHVRILENQFGTLRNLPPEDIIDGVWKYVSPDSLTVVAKDFREKGHLLRREYYDKDEMRIASDEFIYSDQIVIAKQRLYYDNSGNIMLFERYAQDGLLSMAMVPTKVAEPPDRNLSLKVIRSPLPPAALSFYR